jgi:hypothetical protein
MTIMDPDSASRAWTQQVVRDQAAKTAWHAYNDLERATNAARACLVDSNTPPEWVDQLRAVALRAGALAVEEV